MLPLFSGLKCVGWGMQYVGLYRCIHSFSFPFPSFIENNILALNGGISLYIISVGPDWAPVCLPQIWVTPLFITCLYNPIDTSSYALQPWIWRLHVPVKCHPLARLHGVKIQTHSVIVVICSWHVWSEFKHMAESDGMLASCWLASLEVPVFMVCVILWFFLQNSR
jgi:hypothetical protein